MAESPVFIEGDAAAQTSTEAKDAAKLADVLGDRHPIFTERRRHWKRHLDLFESTNLGDYIDRHARESKQSHDQRKERIVYRNYVRSVIEYHTHFIFSRDIQRSPAPREMVQERERLEKDGFLGNGSNVAMMRTKVDPEWERGFLNDCDRCGTSLTNWMKTTADLTWLFGKTYALVDQPPSGPIRNEAERKRIGVRPYVVRYNPLNVVNWELDKDGKLVWIRTLEPLSNVVGPFEKRDEALKRILRDQYNLSTRDASRRANIVIAGKGHPPALYRTWTADSWVVHQVVENVAIEIAGAGHHLGEVPFVSIYNKKGSVDPFNGYSLVEDISTIGKMILNIDSLITESVYQQTLSILVIGRQTVEGEEIVVSESNVLEVSPGSFPPFFLTPSTAPVQFMEQRINILAQDVYRLAKLATAFGVETKGVAPGTAAYEFNVSNRSLAEKADNLEEGEYEIHRLYYAWHQQEFRGFVDYPDDFSIESPAELVQLLQLAKENLRSETAIRELEFKAAKRILGSQDEEIIDQIRKETYFIPSFIKTFTGLIFYDALTQEQSMPGGKPIGKLAEALEELGVDVADLPSVEEQKAEKQQQQQLEGEEARGEIQQRQQIEGEAARAEIQAAHQPPQQQKPAGQGGPSSAKKPGGAPRRPNKPKRR